MPLQAADCAAKHGVKGFTDSLRTELERESSGIAVTLVLPSSIALWWRRTGRRSG